MNISMFTSWQVRCGIADYTEQLVQALDQLSDTSVSIVPFDRQAHPRSDYVVWGDAMNQGDVAHIQHEYPFFGYLLPWRNHFRAFTDRIRKPLVMTRHVSFDGPLQIPGRGLAHTIRQAKWWFYQHGPYGRVLNKDTFARAQQIIVLSERLKGHLVARGIDQRRVHVIPAGVPAVAKASAVAAQKLRAQFGWENKRIVGQFGFIAPAKGHATMLEALANLPDDYVYLIAGGARVDAHQTVQTELQSRALAMGLGNRIRITGYLPKTEIAAHIAACDALVFPNTHADFSYSVVQALAYGTTPIIASDVYGHREIARDSQALTLFPSGDAQSLAATIQRQLGTSDWREQFQQKAALYRHAFSWSAIAQRTRDVYRLALLGN